MIILYNIVYNVPCDLCGKKAIQLNQRVSCINGEVYIHKDGEDRVCNAKSLLGLLSLRIEKGDKMVLETDSKDYKDIFEIVENILNKE